MSRRLNWRLQRLEQLEQRILLSVADYGDAPTSAQSGFASSYPTMLADNGARHLAAGPILGAIRGVESDGQPTSGANGDDNDGDDDEDGVTFVPGFLTPGDVASTVEVDMIASPDGGRLNAWIDFNADGDWDDSGEQIFTNTALTGGTVNSLTFVVPAEAELGPTYARFRVNTMGGLGYGGLADNGEVEDYRISIAIPPNAHGLFPGEQFPAGLVPSSVVAADLNGDTYVDLITSNRLSHDVSVLLGLGDGTFATQVNYSVGGQPTDVAMADLNGDGHMDIVATNGLDDRISVLLGHGDGTFAAQVTYGVGRSPRSVALSDIDGDNKVDIVVANGTDRNVSVLLGRGNGTFAAQVTYALGTQPWGPRPESVALADLNGDDYPDIVTANDITDDISVLLNLGDGTFAPYVNYAAGGDPNSVALADLNGDDYVDIVISHYLNGAVQVFMGVGDGTFVAPVSYDVGGSPSCVSLSDVNHDGYVDILSGQSPRQVAVLLGIGDGTFTTQVSYVVGYGPICVLPVDVNGDGHVDIVTANTDNSVSVLLGYGNGTFPLQVTKAVGKYPCAVAVADLNGDGPADIVAVNRNAHNVSVLLSLGNGTFATQVTYPVGTNPNAVALADLNGDNYVDIVTANALSDNISVLLGVGDGTFDAQVTYGATDGPISVALADLNGDSHVDIVAANTSNNNVSVLLGLGDGTFNEQVSYPVGFAPYWVALSDLNGDSYVDIVTTNEVDGNVSVLLGLGDGTFDAQVTYAVGNHPQGVALVDLNGDTHVDIVAANLWDNNVSVLLGIGGGTFATQATHAVGDYPQAVVSDDINGDGYADIVVTNYGPNNISVLLGIGDGTFATQAMYATGTGPSAVAVADLISNVAAAADLRPNAMAGDETNADIHKDLVTANSQDNNVSVLLNQRRSKVLDYGDAPDPTYPTLLASDGARHTATGPTLGLHRDTETDGQPTTDANSDDTTGSPDDEDGVTLPGLTASTFNTTTASVTVDLQKADPSSNRLDAWIDFNQDGDWDDAGERIFTSYDLGTTDGTQLLTFTVPQDTGGNIVYGTTYARFRLSTAGGLVPTGLAGDGEVEDYQVTIHSHVVGRHVFYNRSAWDGNSAAANANDDNAIALDKQALVAGQQATFVNYTSYSRGINAVMIDIADLADPASLSVSDFELRVGNNPNPASWPLLTLDPSLIIVSVRQGEGTSGSDRVTVILPDGAVKKTWLQVTVKATAATGLATPDVHYWGNAVGDCGNSLTDTAVNVADQLGARANPHTLLTPAPIDDAYDFNRDKQVNVQDELIARSNPSTLLTDLNLIDLRAYGEGEGEGDGQTLAAWGNGPLAGTVLPLPPAATRNVLVVSPSPSSSERELLPMIVFPSVTPAGQSAAGNHRAPTIADLGYPETASHWFEEPLAPAAAIVIGSHDVHGEPLPWPPSENELSRLSWTNLAAFPWQAGRLTRESGMHPRDSSIARPHESIDRYVPAGLLEESDHWNDLARRIRWAREGEQQEQWNTIDQALQELLPGDDWEQL